jgi:hypothetical protein
MSGRLESEVRVRGCRAAIEVNAAAEHRRKSEMRIQDVLSEVLVEFIIDRAGIARGTPWDRAGKTGREGFKLKLSRILFTIFALGIYAKLNEIQS